MKKMTKKNGLMWMYIKILITTRDSIVFILMLIPFGIK